MLSITISKFNTNFCSVFYSIAPLSFDVVNEENNLATPLGNHSSLVEKFVLQSDNMALDATVDTQTRHNTKTFLHNSNTLSTSKSKTNSFHKARKIGTPDIPSIEFALSLV